MRQRSHILEVLLINVTQMSTLKKRKLKWAIGTVLAGLAFLVCLSSIPARSQDVWSLPEVARACGLRSAKLDVRRIDGTHRTVQQPRRGRGLLYVIQDVQEQVPANSSLTTRFGADGRWVGANQGRSYFTLELQPGIHHLCVSGQWTRLRSTNSIALRRIVVQPDQIYFLRVRLLYPNAGSISLALETVDGDEGRLLIDTSAYSESHTK